MPAGGKRKGAGQPKKEPKDYDSALKKRMLAAAEKLSRKYKETIEYAVLKQIYDPEVQDTAKVGYFKLWCECFAVKSSEQNINVTKAESPKIYLPKSLPDPAFQVVDGGKK